jgi:phosphoribosylformylglycinamidine synthase
MSQKTKCGIVVFPGTTGAQDSARALEVLGIDFSFIPHTETELDGFGAIILPGGFSYGDYLRPGAVAALSPVIENLKAFALKGGKILGVGNGFQILCEAGILPGALQTNENLSFSCKELDLRVEAQCDWLDLEVGTVISLPVAHGAGDYVADMDVLRQIEENDQIVLKDADEAIVGVCNTGGNVLGLMAHPERAVEELLGGTDGKLFFAGLA